MMNKHIAVGTNVAGLKYYSSDIKFRDIHKQSQEWVTQRNGVHSWDTHEQDKIHWRPDGYPTSLEPDQTLAQIIKGGSTSYAEIGNFTVLYDGEGIIQFTDKTFKIAYEGKGRMVMNISMISKSGIIIKILTTNAANPIHNIRITPSSYEYIQDRFPFYPIYLENLKRYSEIRFMDFLHTNHHAPEPTTWNDRGTPDRYTQAGARGGAIETMVQLANTLGANPWFNMPHAATDDYVRNFAQLVKNSLRSDLMVYLEYSNEVWNGIFRQAIYAEEQGMKLQLDSNKRIAGSKYYGKRAAEIADIWNQVYGDDKDKVYPVLAWITVSTRRFDQTVAELGNDINKFKALAITAYFDCDSAARRHSHEFLNMSMTDIQQLCAKDIPVFTDLFHHYINLSKSHGLQLVIYEGGPGMYGSVTIKEHALAFNRDVHIEKPIIDIMGLWNDIVTKDPSNKLPGGLFNYFTNTLKPTSSGSWGMLDHTSQDPLTSPKFHAVQTYITDHYKDNPLGPKCSFVIYGAMAYGCFQQAPGNFKCGQTDNSGRSWHFYAGLHPPHGNYLVLDGYNPQLSFLYIRVTDTLGVSTHHLLKTSTGTVTDVKNVDYYNELAASEVLPRFPNEVYENLNSHAQC